MMLRFMTTLFVLFSLLQIAVASLLPSQIFRSFLEPHRRTVPPFFPDTPSSCPKCAQDYGNINSCAEAAPVLTNFSMIIFNPGAFIDVIKCACTDTFQAVFPQCVDCFTRTNQSQVLNTPNLPAVVDGMRKVCAIASTLLGNVSVSNGDATPAPSPAVKTNTASPLPIGALVWATTAAVTLVAISFVNLVSSL